MMVAAPRKVHRLKVVTSTNDEARALAGEGAPHGTVVTAESQTAGRGRRGRVWASPEGNLFLSVILRPEIEPGAAPPLAPAIGLAVARAIEEVAPVPAKVKWPNDVLVNDRKVAGVLTESVVSGGRLEAVVVGIGINVGSELPPELKEVATTLSREAGRNVRRSEVEEALLSEVDQIFGRFLRGGFASLAREWRERDALLGRRVSIEGGAGRVEGVAAGIGADGALQVQVAGGKVVAVTTGEVL